MMQNLFGEKKLLDKLPTMIPNIIPNIIPTMLPDKPNSPNQQYRLTENGMVLKMQLIQTRGNK
jgi:hypothetical protein